MIEVKTPLNHRDYSTLLAQEDPSHFLVYKTRRCFMWQNQYFQLDIYRQPCHPRCQVTKMLNKDDFLCLASFVWIQFAGFSPVYSVLKAAPLTGLEML